MLIRPRYRARQDNGDQMEELMPEDYKEFNVADYVKTKADVRELLSAGRRQMRTSGTGT